MSCLLLTCSAIGALPARAEDSPTDKTGATAHGTSAATAAGAMFTVSIPSIDAKDSSIDTDTLKAILSGDVAAHAGELAKLSATSIKVPEITMSYSAPDGGGGGITYTQRPGP